MLSTSAFEVESDQEQLVANMEPQISNWNRICEHLTTLAHICILGFSFYIISICISGKLDTFSLHPLLLTLGWMLFMNEAILMISKDNILSARMSLKWRTRWHWVMQVIALISSLSGVLVIYVLKDKFQDEHFRSYHAIFGITALALALVPTLFSGLTSLFSAELRRFVPPKLNKLIHTVFGMLSLLFGAIAITYSLYFNWFKSRTGNSGHIFVLCFVCVTFGTFWVLLKPLLNSSQRIKTFLY